MSWAISTDSAVYENTAGRFVRSRPSEHTVILSVAERVRRSGPDAYGNQPPQYGWWTGPDGAVGAAFLRTPPHPILLTDLPDGAAEELAGSYARLDPALSGVSGPRAAADAFGAAWRAETGTPVAVGQNQRLYRLGELASPAPRAGQSGRIAAEADRALLTAWWTAFARASGDPSPRRAEQQADDWLSRGAITLWQDAGRPVSMAGHTFAVEGTVRVAPVYTPEPLRGRGYAAAATAQVCRTALAAGAREILLFTDLANPVSNALYQRLGFRPVRDHRVLRFG